MGQVGSAELRGVDSNNDKQVNVGQVGSAE